MTNDHTDDEPTEAELTEEARIDGPLAASSGAVRQVIEEGHQAFGYGIPTVTLGLVGQWYCKAAASADPDAARDAQRAAQVLSDLFARGDDDMQTAIATGFLEVLPYPHEEDRHVVELLPGPLREERRRMENWKPA